MRYAHSSGVSAWFVFGLLAITVVFYLLTRFIAQRQKRRDPDRGGSGYTPVDNAPTPSIPRGLPDIDPAALWLLGFSAPKAMAVGAEVFSWDPGTRFADRSFAKSLSRAERTQKTARTAQERIAAAVDAAWWVRCGVAAGGLTIAQAAERTTIIAQQTRKDADNWLGFGDLLGEHRGLAAPRVLYRPGNLWASPKWPDFP